MIITVIPAILLQSKLLQDVFSNVAVHSVFSGYHDEYLPSVYGGRINGEEVGRQHKKGLCQEKSNASQLNKSTK